jgi:UDP-N-acetylmuramyl pentapeptide synthase
MTFPNAIALKEYILSKPIKGHFILVKGSRGIGLEKIYDIL